MTGRRMRGVKADPKVWCLGTNWRKISAKHISDRGLVCKHIKNSYNSLIGGNITQFLKIAKDLNKLSTKKDIQVANENTGRFSASLAVREMHHNEIPLHTH